MASTHSGTNSSKTKSTIEIVGGIYCKICNKTLKNKKDYDPHYVEHTGSKDIVYSCVICHKDITGYPSFRGHCYTSHVIKNRFKCEECLKLFSKMSALKDHITSIHQNCCTTCNKTFSTKKELHIHEIIHRSNDGPPFNCQVCKINIDSLDLCKTHVDLHSSFTYTCPICDDIIPQKEFATDHLMKHFGNVTTEQIIPKTFSSTNTSLEQLGGISCFYCTMIVPTRSEFDAHFLCEHGEEDILYTCVVCGKPFTKYTSFSDHVYNHFTKGRFECDLCLKSFPRLSLLVTHISACANADDDKSNPFICFHCSHRYSTEKRLDEHLRKAHKSLTLKCPEPGCEKIFDKSRELILHQRHHNTNIKNWCRQCGMLFTSLVSCERHLDIHKRKLFACPICNRNYSEKNMIIMHLPQHFETTLHVCKVCGKVYNAKYRLIQHLKSHTENKDYKCIYCSKSFSKSSNLEQHMNIHKGVKPYKCDICIKSFTSYPNFNKHMNNIHNMIVRKPKSLESAALVAENTDVLINSNNDFIESNNYTQNYEIDTQENGFDFKGVMVDNNNILDVYPTLLDQRNGQNLTEYILYDAEQNTADNIDMIDKDSLFGNALQISADSTQIDNISTTKVEPANSNIPLEYGPEFTSNMDGAGFIDLDDHILPHIDPLLPHLDPLLDVTNEISTNQHINIDAEKWEPPIITKFYQECYGYEMSDSNIVSMINTDIF